MTLGLTVRQAQIVAFVSLFITVIGGFLLAIYFRRRNRMPWKKWWK